MANYPANPFDVTGLIRKGEKNENNINTRNNLNCVGTTVLAFAGTHGANGCSASWSRSEILGIILQPEEFCANRPSHWWLNCWCPLHDQPTPVYYWRVDGHRDCGLNSLLDGSARRTVLSGQRMGRILIIVTAFVWFGCAWSSYGQADSRSNYSTFEFTWEDRSQSGWGAWVDQQVQELLRFMTQVALIIVAVQWLLVALQYMVGPVPGQMLIAMIWGTVLVAGSTSVAGLIYEPLFR